MVASPSFAPLVSVRPAATRPPRRVQHSAAAPAPSPRKAAVVKFPRQARFSLGLRLLFLVQQGSSLLAFCLATAVLITYGSTVYIQQEWGEEYRKLETLQREQRELIAASELMKNQLAQQASLPNAGLMPPSPANTIFLPKTNDRAFAPSAAKSTTPLVDVTAKTPLGY
ncbi:MAG: hypothetical protein ACPGVO_19190 [Spirulinaceae cyanobacterium]